MGLLRKCKKRKENLDFLTLWARLVEEENEEHDLLGRTHVLSSSCSLGKKKFNLILFFYFLFFKIRRLEFTIIIIFI